MSELRKIKVIKKADKPPPDADDDLRRLAVSIANVLKRRFPKEYRRLMAENEAANAT